MISSNTIFKQIHKKWYAQGFNCTPLLLSGPALSGFDVKPTIGANYTSFLWEYKNEYGKMYYGVADLHKIGRLLVEKIKKEKNCIQKLRQEDQQRQKKIEQDLFIISEEKYPSLSDKELYELLRKALFANRDVGRISHIIEGFSLTTDVDIKQRLEKYVQDPKKLNEYLSLLSTPTERSFIHEREEDLHHISFIESVAQRKKAITTHLQKFYWVRNTYAGRIRITETEIEQELKEVKYEPIDLEKIKREQEAIIQKLQLDEELVLLLRSSAEITAWQDVRKKNIFINIDIVEGVMNEFSRRFDIDHQLLRYFTQTEIRQGYVFDPVKLPEMVKMLQERRAGMVHYAEESGEEGILAGEEYVQFHRLIGQEEKKKLETKEFKGMTACTGIAIGRVRICTSLQAIREFKEGEVLVASMTRPEYLPAMKKAAAIVTDEGGITCHAAIVSRELKLPCIIGTKIATKLLKDGDLIEVKANHGLVIIRN